MLIQDDFGLQPLDNGSRMHLMDIIEDRYGKKSTLMAIVMQSVLISYHIGLHLMDIIEDRYGKKSTLIASQLPVKDKYDVIGKETIAGAVMYRITHQAARIELHGESLRKICGKK